MLADTSVWVDHLRRSNAALARALEEGIVECHPFVVGELACGSIADRDEVLPLLAALPEAPVASHEEAMGFVLRHRLAGRGLGWIDIHLLCSARLAGTTMWTLGKRLRSAAIEVGIDAGMG